MPGPATWPTATHSDDVRQAEQDQRSPGGAVSERELDELFDKLIGALDDLGVEVDSFITAEQSLVGREVQLRLVESSLQQSSDNMESVCQQLESRAMEVDPELQRSKLQSTKKL